MMSDARVIGVEHIEDARRRGRKVFEILPGDIVTSLAEETASRLGLEVPTKLSVGGFDDTPLAQILFPQLTTVKQPIYEMGKMAANLLINPPTRDDLLPSYHLDHKLIIRKSTDNQNILDN